MKKFGRGLLASTVLAALAFGACSNSGDGKNISYGGSGPSAAGAQAGASAQGGVGAITSVGGSLGGVDGQAGSSSGGSGGTGMQRLINDCPGSLDPAAAQA